MNQEEFRKANEDTWKKYKAMIAEMNVSKKKKQIANTHEFPHLYRKLCQHLDLARSRNYGTHMTDMINDMVLQGHQYLYYFQASRMGNIKRMLLVDFPRAVRADIKLFWVSSLLFYGPFIFMMVLIHQSPEMVYSVIDLETVAQMEEMYDPSEIHARDFSDDVTMFGFYIYNNTGIGLRTFGSSLILGVGSIFTLIFNGTYIGAVFGHLHNEGMGDNLFPFVIGHGSFELTAIVIAGMAGLKLGFAFLIPQNLTRKQSLVLTARECMPLVYGFTTMFFIAAFIEGFWSPINEAIVSDNTKFVVGGFLWIFVALYLMLMGRKSHA